MSNDQPDDQCTAQRAAAEARNRQLIRGVVMSVLTADENALPGPVAEARRELERKVRQPQG